MECPLAPIAVLDPWRQTAIVVGATLYDPINVYKPLAANIGVVDGPFEYFSVAGMRMPMPFTTRMTVVRLANGELFLHSPIKYDPALAAELQGMGTVRHLISPNQWHYAHVGEWQRAFPDAVAWGSPAARRRANARKIEVQFTRYLEADAPPEWRSEIEQTLMPGGIFKEFVFFHCASKTLILTDTVMNLETSKTNRPWSTVARLTAMHAPRGGIFFGMRVPLLLQQKKAAAAFQTIRAWQPQRIVLAHGTIFEGDADQVIRRLFRR